MPQWCAEDGTEVTVEISTDAHVNTIVTFTASHAGHPITVQPHGHPDGIWTYSFAPAKDASFWVTVTSITGTGDIWMLCEQHGQGLIAVDDVAGQPIHPLREPVKIGHVAPGSPDVIANTGLIGP